MKMKKFFSGIIAAITAFAAVAMPMSTANAADDDKCTITINHAATSGTYKAYPIFYGNVEKEYAEDGTTPTGRLLIDSPKFHSNLKTKISSNQVADGNDIDDNSNTIKYGLFEYINGSTRINEKTFAELMKEYDPNTSLTNLTITIGVTNPPAKDQAELIANTLNLTNNSNAVNQIVDASGNKATSAFYSAFAEAARLFMIDNIAGTPGTLTGVKDPVTATGGVATITVDEPGYYLVEYTPNGEYVDSPRAVRRSLVLVGYDKNDCGATINSKDTENITTVDIQFYDKTGTATFDTDGTTVTSVAFPDDGNWAKNVSAGNGDYVNCRVVVTLPSNLSVYDQYYLAVPIMYGYNTKSSGFDFTKSITRVGSGVEIGVQVTSQPENNGQLYLASNESGDKLSSVWLSGDERNNYNYANTDNNNAAVKAEDKFVSKDVLVIKDLKSLYVAGVGNPSKFAAYGDSEIFKLTFTFPVQFNRFSGNILNEGASSGVNATGYDIGYVYGDDALMKNYITAKAVYSNNPNLKKLDNPGDAYEIKGNPEGVKLYLDTSKNPGTLQNPVGISKETSANIVTYRLRVHATTDDLVNLSQNGGVEGVRFALMDNKTGKYAQVKLLGNLPIYDTVDDELIRETAPNNPNASANQGSANVYKITGWIDKPDSIDLTSLNYILRTYNQNNTPNGKGQFANNNSGRFEILGLAPGGYTLVALDENIKTADTYATPINDATHNKDYKLPKEDGTPKTEYKFSFAPTLVETCTKLPYLTHYAPAGSTAAASPDGSAVTQDTDILIKNFNMKWWKGTDEITDKPDWWVGENQDVALMSMRVTYIKKGLTLPVTGGIGTFLFFAIGGAMVVISTVAIVTKFRVKRERL